MKTSKFNLQKSMQNFTTNSFAYLSNSNSNFMFIKCSLLNPYLKYILCLFVLLGFSSFKTLSFTQPNHYQIVAEINPETSSIKGSVRIEYHNPTNQDLDHILLRVKDPIDYLPVSIQIENVFEKTNTPLKINKTFTNENLLRIDLNNPLEPNGSMVLYVKFNVSYIQTPYGYSGVQSLWHPKVAVYRHNQFSPVEEQADNYEVTIKIPKEYSLVTSGTIQSKEINNGIRTLNFTASNITGFGFAFSSEFEINEFNAGNTIITVVTMKNEQDKAALIARISKEVIQFYKNIFGFYPQPNIIILPGGQIGKGGFPIASNMVAIHKPSLLWESYLKWIIAHEIGHQYWGFDLVIDSRSTHHWLGLGLGIYSDRLYNETHNVEGLSEHARILSSYTAGVARGYNTSLMQDYTVLAKEKFAWNNIISHGKGYAVIYLLEKIVGEEIFFQAIKHILEEYQHKYLSVNDFKGVLEKKAGKNLDWFFEDWVYENRVYEFKIDTVSSKNNQTIVGIRRTGEARLPATNVKIVFADNTSLSKTIDKNLQYQEIIFDYPGEPIWVELDPEHNFIPIAHNLEKTRWGVYPYLEVIETIIPPLAWNISTVKFSIKNKSNEKRMITSDIQARSILGGTGMGKNHIIQPDETIEIQHEVFLKPIPGNHTIWVNVEWSSYSLIKSRINKVFPHYNKKINPFITTDYSFFTENSYSAFNVYKSENLIFYYLPEDDYIINNIDYLITNRRNALDYLKGIIYPSFNDTIALFFFENHEAKKDLTGHTGMGWALPNNSIYEVYNENEQCDPNHELVHILSRKIGNPPAILNEGHAVYHHADKKWNEIHYNDWVIKFSKENKLIPLKTLFTFTEIGSIESQWFVAYPQAASVVDFIITTFGYSKFLEVYRSIELNDIRLGIEVIDDKLKNILGMGIDEMESNWLKTIFTN